MPLGYNFNNINTNTGTASGAVTEPIFQEKKIGSGTVNSNPIVLPAETNTFGTPPPAAPSVQPQTASSGFDLTQFWNQYKVWIMVIALVIVLGFVYWKFIN